MDKDDLKKRIVQEEDYVRSPKFSNSLIKFLAKNGDGVDDSTIARLLMIPEEDVRKVYEEAVILLKKEMVEKE